MLRLKNISKTYSTKDGVTHRALNNISLDFQEKGLYLKFVNDDTQYVFYEFNDIKYDYLGSYDYFQRYFKRTKYTKGI